jgi:hypothetical protein
MVQSNQNSGKLSEAKSGTAEYIEAGQVELPSRIHNTKSNSLNTSVIQTQTQEKLHIIEYIGNTEGEMEDIQEMSNNSESLIHNQTATIQNLHTQGSGQESFDHLNILN